MLARLCLCQSKSNRWQMTSASIFQSATETERRRNIKIKKLQFAKQETFDVVKTDWKLCLSCFEVLNYLTLWLSCFEDWSFETSDTVTTNKRIMSVMFWSLKPIRAERSGSWRCFIKTSCLLHFIYTYQIQIQMHICTNTYTNTKLERSGSSIQICFFMYHSPIQ